MKYFHQGNADDAIFITNEEGTILNVNQVFTDITGYTSNDVIGKTPSILKSGKHDSDYYKEMWNTLLNRGTWNGYIWNKTKAGETFLEHLSINAIYSVTGKKYFIATFRESEVCTAQLDMEQCHIQTANKDIVTDKELLEAIENNEFKLHYQPLIDNASNKIYGVEALLRWDKPNVGLIAPMEFIPLAEQTGLIIPLGKQILQMACVEALKLHHHTKVNMRLLVNVSVKQVVDSNFIQMVKDVLEQTDFPPELLELEITESIFLENTQNILTKLNDIKQLGIKLSLDDFGTGYSSLQYLKYFPFDTLKIDRTFLQDIHIDKVNAALLEAIILMGEKLGLHIIAEGVETIEQLNFLKERNCNIMQGYYISKPLEYTQIFQFLNYA